MIEKQQQNQARDVFCHVLPRADDRLWRANVATPTLLCSRMRAATIRGRLLFLWWTSRCGYYSRAATIRGAASIRINTVYYSNKYYRLRLISYKSVLVIFFIVIRS